MPYLDAPVREHTTLEGALEAIFDKLDTLDDGLDGLGSYVRSLDGYVRSLDGYVRNHLTTKMENGFEEVKDSILKVSNTLQDHVH